MSGKNSLKGPALVLAGSLCFSTSGFLQAIAPSGATPFVIGGSRLLIGALVLLLFILLGEKKPSFRHWPWKHVGMYAVALWLYQISFFHAVLAVGVAVGTVVSIGVTPVVSGLITWAKDKKSPSFMWCLATALAVTGLFLMNDMSGSKFDSFDLLLPVFAGACYAVEICVSKPLTERHTAQESMMLIMFLAGLGLLPFFFFNPVSWILTGEGMLVVLGLGVVTAACAFSLMTAGLKDTPAPIASTLALGEPMGAALLGILVLQEPCPAQTLAGIVCIFMSILLLIFFEPGKS